MKLQITKENLLNGLRAVERAVGKNATLPIISNVYLKTEVTGLKLATTNLEVGVISSVPAKIEEEGEFTVPAIKFITYIHNLPDEKILLARDGNKLIVKSESGDASFIGEEAKDFPLIPEVNGKKRINLTSKDIKVMLVQTSGATAFTETRPEIAGVYWLFDNSNKSENSTLRIVATDSYRLAEKTLQLKENIVNDDGSELNFIIPKNTAIELVRLIDNEEALLVVIDDNQVQFEIGSRIKLISRLVEGVYPNYRAIIPENYLTRMVFNKTDLKDSIGLVSLFASDKTQEIKLTLDTDSKKVNIEALSNEVGSGKRSVECIGESTGEQVEFNLNHRYLMDGLSWLDGDEIVFEVQDSEKPVVLKPAKAKDYLYLIMPLKN